MTRDWRKDTRSQDPGYEAPRRVAPGKVSLTQHLPSSSRPDRGETSGEQSHPLAATAITSSPVQLKASDDPFGLHLSANQAQEIAGAGLAEPARTLPHLDAIQASFGPHDVGSVRAHVGGAAADASSAMGARAYATGNDVAFASSPDLHLAAHEAAHVVQQRSGVSLKGAVGHSGDEYERQADAVADAVVAGRSAAALLGEPGGGVGDVVVQRQAAGGSAAPSPTVDVTVTWTSPFGNNLTGSVTLFGRAGTSGAWTRIDTQQVADANTATFAGATRFRFYKARIQPADDVEGDDQAVGKFKKTELTSAAVGATAATAQVTGGIELNRWNEDNVSQRHRREGIDPAQTGEANMRSVPLFTRKVRVHRLLVPRVERTNALFLALPADEQQEVAQSLFVTGGYAYRNQVGKRGAFSDHSVGMAIDVNYNEGKMQNALMESRGELDVLNKLVQPVVRTDASMADFDIWAAQGQQQLRASHVFNERFPRYLAELLGRDADVNALDQADAAGLFGNGALRKALATGNLFGAVTPAMINAAAATEADAAKKAKLKLIADNWEALRSWIVGASVVDKHPGEKNPDGTPKAHEYKTARGMIPLDERVLQMFLDAGWDWGGDWTRGTRKDYMHFEDPTLLEQIQLDDDNDGNP